MDTVNTVRERFEAAKADVFHHPSFPTQVDIVDESMGGCGTKLHITVSSAVFAGMKAMAKHRLVQGVIDDMIKSNEVHAVTIKTVTLG